MINIGRKTERKTEKKQSLTKWVAFYDKMSYVYFFNKHKRDSMKSTPKDLKNKEQESIEKKLENLDLEKRAKESGFNRRRPKKIHPKEFLLGFILMAYKACNNSIENWAKEIGILIGDTVSKQGLWKRMTESQIKFLDGVLATILKRSIEIKNRSKLAEKMQYFKNIYIQDSTKILLNEKLNKYYSGKSNGKSNKVKGALKIQVIYNITKGIFSRFKTTSYRRNDQSMSSEILEVAEAGDLVVRDLGYFAVKIFQKMINKGINYISRLRYQVNIYDRSGREIDLLKILRGKEVIDIDVLVGMEEKVEMRLVAVKLGAEIARERRRKARGNRDRRTNHSNRYYKLLGWNIFITNVEKDVLTAQNIKEVYSIRWQIEIIFKCWKSYFRVVDIPKKNANKIRIESYIYCMLIFITLFQVDYYRHYEKSIDEQKESYISLMKFSQFMVSSISLMLVSSFEIFESDTALFEKFIKYYCRYESRNGKKNLCQKINFLS
jgi:hypothetical protein